jgi:PAS domain S-box-containing protein
VDAVAGAAHDGDDLLSPRDAARTSTDPRAEAGYSTADEPKQAVERRRDAQALRAKEARHRAMLDAALDCVVTMDHNGRVVDLNPAAERCFGYRERGGRTRDGRADRPAELRERHRRGLARYLASEQPVLLDRRVEITGMRADGTKFPVELAITRIDVPGPPTFAGYLRDITDRKAAEAELRASRARIVEAADAARRRLKRDLHDGAQQRLVELGLDLRMARSRRSPAATGRAGPRPAYGALPPRRRSGARARAARRGSR